MKNIVLGILLLLSVSITAQDNVFIKVCVPENGTVSEEARKLVANKLTQLITANGIADNDINSRFVITCKTNVISKDILSTTPQRISEKIEFTFFVGDIVENKVFEHCSVECNGIGINENKAYISAISNIKPSNEQIVSFLAKSKEKIKNYYDQQCENILKQADLDAAAGKFDAGIYKLMQVPDVCSCSEECKDMAADIYRKSNHQKAQTLLHQAKASWSKSPNAEGATQAASIIKRIPYDPEVQTDIDDLCREIGGRLKDIERREWEQKVREYEDYIETEKREYEFRVQQEQNRTEYQARQQAADNAYRMQQQQTDAEYRRIQQQANNAARQQTIEACRQVGVEFSRHLPQTININKNLLSW